MMYLRLWPWVGLLFMLVSGCRSTESDATFLCTPECGPSLVCLEGVCQPVLCSDRRDCALDQICYEGRCIRSCDGDTPCPSGACDDNLCSETMECENGAVRACETACGEGVERCNGFTWSICSSGVPTERDFCGDGIDGDCDGETDEGCPACQPDARRPCDNECGQGEQVCEAGQWTGCSQPPPDATGVCPCIDDAVQACESPCGLGQQVCESGTFGGCMVDGRLCECMAGAREACEAACGMGERECVAGQWSDCMGPAPSAELCGNGLDEDCDDQVDEGCGDCLVAFLSSPADIVELDSRYQSTNIVDRGAQVWMGYYGQTDGRRISHYLQYRVSGDSFQFDRRHTSELRTLIGLHAGDINVLGYGYDQQNRMALELMSSQGARRFESLDRVAGLSPDFQGLIDGTTMYLLYRTLDGLYVQAIPEAQARPQPLLFSGDGDVLQMTGALDRMGLSVFYASNEGNFEGGTVLKMARASLAPLRARGDAQLLNPVSNAPIFGESPAVIYANDRYLVVYSARSSRRSSLFSMVVDLNGVVLGEPIEIFRAPSGEYVSHHELAGTSRGLLVNILVTPGVDEVSQVKYASLSFDGALTSPSVQVLSGIIAFPRLTVPSATGRPVFVWPEDNANTMETRLRMATVPRTPTCP